MCPLESSLTTEYIVTYKKLIKLTNIIELWRNGLTVEEAGNHPDLVKFGIIDKDIKKVFDFLEKDSKQALKEHFNPNVNWAE